MSLDIFVSVVAPVYNDEDIVVSFIDDTMAVLGKHYRNYELLLVDDRSTDGTAGRIEELMAVHPGLRLIRLSRAFGAEIAIAAGLDSAIGDFVAVLLPESDPPALLPQMVEQCRTKAGVVYGIRESRKGDPVLQRMGSAAFYWVANKLFGLSIPKDSTHFRVMSRQAVNAITRIRDRYRYLRTLTDFVGYEPVSLKYELVSRRPRPRRKSLIEAITLAGRILVSTSLQPLYLVSWLGFLGAAGSAAFLGYVILIYLFKDRVAEGWTTLSMVMTTMLGMLSLSLGVAATYLARLLDQTQDRPLYFVMDEQGGAVPLVEAARKNVVSDAAHE